MWSDFNRKCLDRMNKGQIKPLTYCTGLCTLTIFCCWESYLTLFMMCWWCRFTYLVHVLQIVSTATFTLEVVNCPPGYKLTSTTPDGSQNSCSCNFDNDEILMCNQTSISFEVKTHIHTYMNTCIELSHLCIKLDCLDSPYIVVVTLFKCIPFPVLLSMLYGSILIYGSTLCGLQPVTSKKMSCSCTLVRLVIVDAWSTKHWDVIVFLYMTATILIASVSVIGKVWEKCTWFWNTPWS